MATHSRNFPRESRGQRSLVGCCPQGHTESGTNEAAQYTCMHWRRKWQPTPVFLPRESRGQGSLVGCCPQDCTESGMTEATYLACMHWRRKWQPTPVFFPGESQGWRSLVGCRLWGRTESNTTEATQLQLCAQGKEDSERKSLNSADLEIACSLDQKGHERGEPSCFEQSSKVGGGVGHGLAN